MKLVYLDESGISDQEPLLIVGGVIVDGDAQWKPIQARMVELAKKHVPDHQDGFAFHATDIWSNRGIYSNLTVPQRVAIFDDLCQVIEDFKLPVVWGKTDKTKMAELASEITSLTTPAGRFEVAFMASYSDAVFASNMWMMHFAKEERAMIIAENNNEIRRVLKVLHRMYVGDRAPEELKEVLTQPIAWIIDTVHFAEKRESPMLQMADFVAFLIRATFASHGTDKAARLKPWFDRIGPYMRWRIELPEPLKRHDMTQLG